jgi:hypothetical protein
MQKPIIFISHINEEKSIAMALKKLVESSFLDMMDVFVASDPTSVHLGQKWLDRITDGLKHCVVEIIITSPVAVTRPWINFEGGAGWIRDIPVIPLCHSGMTPSKLPAPLNLLQAAVATNEQELTLIFPVLANAIGSGLPKPDFTEFIETVKQYEATTKEMERFAKQNPVSPTNGLAPHEFATLVGIAEECDTTHTGLSLNAVKRVLGEMGYNHIAAMLAVKKLERVGFVEVIEDSWNNEQFDVVKITNEGWEWLDSNQDKLAMKILPKSTPLVDSDGPPPFPVDDNKPF